MGYTVLHYTLELGEDYVGKRYDAFFTKIPVNKVDAHKDQVAELIPQLPGKLIIKEYPTGKANSLNYRISYFESNKYGFKT